MSTLRLDKNHGFARGVNRTYTIPQNSKYVILLNNNVVPYLDNLIGMTEALEMQENHYMLLTNGDLTVTPLNPLFHGFSRGKFFEKLYGMYDGIRALMWDILDRNTY